MQLRTHAPALLLAAMLISVACQPACAAPPTPPAPPATSAVAEGVLQRYLSTPYGELNGLRLRDGRIVLFGPPMAQSVREAAAVGDPVRVIGHSGRDGIMHAVVVLNLTSGRSASETPPDTVPPPPPPAPRALKRLTAAGTIDAILHGPRGEANGVLLADGALIYFRPELATGPLSPGQPFAAIGIGTSGPQGLAMEAIGVGANLASARQAAPGIPPPQPKEPPPHAH